MSLTGELLERLRRHYIKPSEPLPGGVFIDECGINGGPQSRCDALYAGFTSTSGRILVGHELKVSRADWLHELDQPGKADAWADQCHAWYVVAPSTAVVDPATVPAGWGLMVPSPRSTTRMKIEVKAEVHADRVPSWTAMRSMLARYDTLRAQTITAAKRKADEDARARIADETEKVRATGGARDPRIETLARVVRAAEERIGGFWRAIDEDVLVETLTDAQRVRNLTRDAERSIDRALMAARSLTDPFAKVAQELAAIKRPALALEGDG